MIATQDADPRPPYLDALDWVHSGMAWTILRPGGFASNAYVWAESVRC